MRGVFTLVLIKRLLIALASFALALSAARLALRAVRGERATVRVVDTSPKLFVAFRHRQLETGAPIEEPGLVRVPLSEEVASWFFPANEFTSLYQYDPLCYSRPAPDPDPGFFHFSEHPAGGFHLRVNQQGMRENEDVQAAKRDLRVLVLGDSHTYGLCANEESFANLLEASLAEALPGREVEVLNAGAGYYHFFNYLGSYERLRYLAPDLVVMMAYGGNDFAGAMVLQRYFRARQRPRTGPWVNRAHLLPAGAGDQETHQAIYFLNNPEDEPLAVEMALDVTEELDRQCREDGAELLAAYLPPPTRGQPRLYADLARTSCEVLGIEAQALECSDRIADAWLAALNDRGICTLDLRPSTTAAPERLYWAKDLHLDLAGHRLVARELLPEVVAALDAR